MYMSVCVYIFFLSFRLQADSCDNRNVFLMYIGSEVNNMLDIFTADSILYQSTIHMSLQ